MRIFCQRCDKFLGEQPPFELNCSSPSICSDCKCKPAREVLRILPHNLDLEVIRSLDGFEEEG